MEPLDPRARRVILGHTCAAMGLSLPWPLLLVLVAEQDPDPLLLGVAGAARMLPFVLCSWAAGRLADAVRRDLIVRLTLALRVVLLLGAAVATVAGAVWVAVAATTLAVAVSTPAYPALVAAMPGLAGSRTRGATDLLVTIEVGAFVVGGAGGGLLLGGATRAFVPWLPVLLTALALVIVLPVPMPRPVRAVGAPRPSAYRELRRHPTACRAVAAMAVVNLVDAAVLLTLLPLTLDTWGSDAAGFGLCTGVFGFAALAAPLLHRIGRTPAVAVRRALLLLGAGVLLVAPAPSVGWSLVPLALAGAASVALEAAATGVVQDELPDEVRATVLGVNDTVIVTAALVGSLAAPVAVALVGAGVVLVFLAALLVATAFWFRPRPQAPATVVPSREEADARPDPAATPRRGQPQTAPDQTAPDHSGPDQTGPDQTAPDQTGPDQTAPDGSRRADLGRPAAALGVRVPGQRRGDGRGRDSQRQRVEQQSADRPVGDPHDREVRRAR